MPDSKTIPLPFAGSVPWDSQYNINSTMINMVTDVNGRALSIPVNKLLVDFSDLTAASSPVTIFAIMRANASTGAYNAPFFSNIFSSDYAVVTSTRLTASGTSNCTIIRIDEATQTVVGSVAPLAAGTATLANNFINRGKFSYAQNSADQCMFVDDSGRLYYFTVASTGAISPQPLTFATSRAIYTNPGAGAWGTIATRLDAVDSLAANTGTILDRTLSSLIKSSTLLNAPPTNKQLLVAVVADYGIIYNQTQNCFFFTEQGDFTKMLWVYGSEPLINGSQGQTTGTITVKTWGTVNAARAPGKIVDMLGVGASLWVFTQDGIQKFNLSNVANNPVLQQDMTVSLPYKIRLNSGAIFYQNAIYFVTQDDKLYVMNLKGLVTELTNRIFPDNYFFQYNTFTIAGLQNTFLPSRILTPAKIYGQDMLVQNHTAFNIKTGDFTHLIPNESMNYTWTASSPPNPVCNYTQPKRITASSSDGQIIGLQNHLLFVPSEFDINAMSGSTDYFSCGILMTKQYTFVGKGQGTLAGLSITFKDADFDPSIVGSYSALTLGVYIIVNNAYDPDLINNLFVDSWWANPVGKRQKTFNRIYSTNVFATSMNVTCRSFTVILRFSQFNGGQAFVNIQKFGVENIMANIME